MNKVVAGKYEGNQILHVSERVFISLGLVKKIELSNENVSNYEVITEEHRKSAKSGVARGLVGGALIGPVGLLAGGLSAKSKGTYQLAIEFNDGSRSLIEVDNKVYKSLIKQLFSSYNYDNESNNYNDNNTVDISNSEKNDYDTNTVAKDINPKKKKSAFHYIKIFLIGYFGLALVSGIVLAIVEIIRTVFN